MKFFLVFCAGLCAAAAAFGQSRQGPTPVNEIYGANPTTSAPRTPPPPAPPPAVTPPVETPVAPPAPSVPVVVPLPPPPQLVMPASMTAIDDTRKLALGDRFYFEIVEDRDPKPRLLFVDAQGNADLPYLGARPVQDKTLRQVALETKTALEAKYYQPGKATVLLLFSVATKPRDAYQVLGAVGLPGRKELPADQSLRVSTALHAAGVRSDADLAHVRLIRPDPNDPEKDLPPFELDLTAPFTTGLRAEKDMLIQAGDTIFVQPKGVKLGIITVYGEVNRPGRFDLPANAKLTVSQAVLDAGGLTTWGHPEVKIIRYVTTNGIRTRTTIDVNIHDVLKGGDDSKDVVLQDGDTVRVYQKLFNLGL